MAFTPIIAVVRQTGLQLLKVLPNFVFWDWAIDMGLALGRENHKNRFNPSFYEKALFTDSAIMAYAADHRFDYICISTRGAGMFEKLFGTTTANLIR